MKMIARCGGPPGDKFASDREAASASAAFRVGAEDTAVDTEMSDAVGGGGGGDGGGDGGEPSEAVIIVCRGGHRIG